MFLVHCNSVKNDYQQTSKVLLTFAPNETFEHWINVSPHSLTMVFRDNTEIWWIDQVCKALEIKDYINLTLIIE